MPRPKGSKNTKKVEIETSQEEVKTETTSEVEIETKEEVKKVIVDNAEVVSILEESDTAKHCKMSDGTTKWIENYKF